MQKVTQNTAASAEQGAAASEQMTAHAESMRGAVAELYAMVGGNDEGLAVSAGRTLRRPEARGREMRNGPLARPSAGRTFSAHRDSFSSSSKSQEQEFPLNDAEFTQQ